jgi:hypothetical protein
MSCVSRLRVCSAQYFLLEDRLETFFSNVDVVSFCCIRKMWCCWLILLNLTVVSAWCHHGFVILEYVGSISNECCSEVCYALWIVEVCETSEYIMMTPFPPFIRIEIVLFVWIDSNWNNFKSKCLTIYYCFCYICKSWILLITSEYVTDS